MTKTKGIGIDFKKRSVQIAWRGPLGWELRHAELSNRAEIATALRLAKRSGCGLVVIEKPFVHTKGSKAVAIDLGRACGRIEDICDDVGLRSITVLATVWQTAMLTQSGFTPRNRKELKKASIRSAELMGAKVTNDDQADAVNMAEYGTLNAPYLMEDAS